MEISKARLSAIAKEYEAVTKEPVEIEQICSALYVYGSELAMLRLFYKMAMPAHKSPKVAYSDNLKTFYFSFSL
jgi:hypothetical protein